MGTVSEKLVECACGVPREAAGGVGYKEKQVDMCGVRSWVHTGCESHVGHRARAGSFLYKQGPPAQGPA